MPEETKKQDTNVVPLEAIAPEAIAPAAEKLKVEEYVVIHVNDVNVMLDYINTKPAMETRGMLNAFDSKLGGKAAVPLKDIIERINKEK